MKIRSLLVFTICLLPLAGMSQRLKLNKGDMEVTGSAGFTDAEFSTQARLGVFVQDLTSLGVMLDWSDNDFATRTRFSFYGYQMFETRDYWLPYVGAGIGYASIDADAGGSESGMELTLFSGIKYYLADNVSLNIEFAFGLSSGDTYLTDDGTESTEISLRIGLSYLF